MRRAGRALAAAVGESFEQAAAAKAVAMRILRRVRTRVVSRFDGRFLSPTLLRALNDRRIPELPMRHSVEITRDFHVWYGGIQPAPGWSLVYSLRRPSRRAARATRS